MAKNIDYGKDAFNKLLKGAEKLNNAVSITMGAKGRNVLIEGLYEGDMPHITKDGITVARAVQLKDPVERIGCNLVRKVSLETNEVVGDGSTTAICLATSVLKNGAEALESGANPIMLKRGIDIALTSVLEKLESLKTSLDGNMDMAYEVALVSANGDSEVASLIRDVYEEVGVDGNIAIEPDIHSPYLSYSKVEGIEFDRGFNNPYYVTDIATESVEYQNPVFVISDYRITDIHEIKNVLELYNKVKRPIVLICEELDPQADNMIALNRIKKGLPIVTINAPEFGDRRLNFLEDLAALTGGKFISTVTGLTYDDMTEEHLGEADRIHVTRDRTSIIGGKGNKEIITERIEGVKSQISAAEKEEHKKYLEKRYAKLKGGVIVIKVGGNSDVERVEIRDRVEDAVNATKAALLDGIIPGGGSALLHISSSKLPELSKDGDVNKGISILYASLKSPFRQIIHNAGVTNTQEYESKMEELNKDGLDYVFDVSDGKFVRGIDYGIIDPVLVTKTALKNAASIVGTLLTTGCTISFEASNPEDDKLTV